jgi:hypothetical protein
MTREVDLLAEVGNAAALLMDIANPFKSPDDPTMKDDWSFPVPLNWRLQLRYVWADAADAFDVVAAVLPRRISASVLAQVRFLVESYCLVSWLARPLEDRELRAMRFAMREVNNLRNVLLKWRDHDVARQPTLDGLNDMEAELQRRSAGRTLPSLPAMPVLVERYYARIAYATLSEVGSHPGLSSVVAFRLQPGEQRADLNLGGAHSVRAFHLSMAFELFARTAAMVAEARGWYDYRAGVLQHLDANGDLLREAAQLLEALGTSPEQRDGSRKPFV